MAKMNKAEVQFKVDQLRKDKIVFGVESVAVTLMVTLLVSSLGFIGYMFPMVNEYAKLILQILLGSAVVFFVYMVVTNSMRCLKIKKLEKEL